MARPDRQLSFRRTRFRSARIGDHLSDDIRCQMTSEIVEAPNFRVIIDASKGNGLRVRSQIMADKPVTVRRAWIGQGIGRLNDSDIGRLNIAVAFVMGLAD
jgi:mRNA interferase MazF